MKRMIALVLSLYICAGVLYGQNLNPYEQFGYTPKNQYVLTKTPQGITVTNSDKEVNVAKLVLGLKSRRMFFFDENDSLLNVITVPEDIFVRFISVDPLTGKYPELTPYQYASNRPIDGIDLDGLEHAVATMNGGFNQNASESVSNVSFPDPRAYLRQKFQEMKQADGSIKPGTTNFWTYVNRYTQFLKNVNPDLGKLQEMAYNTLDEVYITYTNIKYGRGYARHLDPTQGTTNYKETIGAGLSTTAMVLGGVQGIGERLLISGVAGETAAATSAVKEVGQFDYTFTKSASRHLNEMVQRGQNAGQLARPYMRSPLTIQEIMSTEKGIPDATFKGGMNWRVPGTFRGSQGTWELGINPQTNVIYHFNFTH